MDSAQILVYDIRENTDTGKGGLMKNTYIGFHTHTIQSDGAFRPMEVCRKAQEAGIGILSITDHNYTEDLTELRHAYPQLQLIQGSEISCLYTNSQGKETELHVIALGIDPNNPKIQRVFAQNQPDRQPYIDAILDRLRQCGIDLGCYRELRQLYSTRRHFGRMDLARLMTDRGHTQSVEHAFDEYLGGHGKRRAFVPNRLRYVSMEEAVEAVMDAGGVAVLAHLYYYLLSDAENAELLSYFKSLTGNRGGMEVFYSLYDRERRMQLKALADEYGLMYSAASDFHGQSGDETLENRFAAEDCSALLEFLGLRQ